MKFCVEEQRSGLGACLRKLSHDLSFSARPASAHGNIPPPSEISTYQSHRCKLSTNRKLSRPKVHESMTKRSRSLQPEYCISSVLVFWLDLLLVLIIPEMTISILTVSWMDSRSWNQTALLRGILYPVIDKVYQLFVMADLVIRYCRLSSG